LPKDIKKRRQSKGLRREGIQPDEKIRGARAVLVPYETIKRISRRT